MSSARVVVVGGGISGLAAAWELQRTAGAGISCSTLPTGPAAAALRARRRRAHRCRRRVRAGPSPRGAAAHRGDRRGAPSPTRRHGRQRVVLRPAAPAPGGHADGGPGRPAAARGLLTRRGGRGASPRRATLAHRTPTGDVSVGDYVAERLGDAVVDRLVEPLLGGVYAGHARRLSLQASVPGLFEVARSGGAHRGCPGSRRAGCCGRQPRVLPASSAGWVCSPSGSPTPPRARCGSAPQHHLRELHRDGPGWQVVLGPVPRSASAADAVVLAVPAAPAARLLTGLAPEAAQELACIEYASMAIITLAVGRPVATCPAPGSWCRLPTVGASRRARSRPRSGRGPPTPPTPSSCGPRSGGHGELVDLQRPDEELVELAVREVGEALGRPLPRLLDAHVQRWGGGLPQYAVGHLERVAGSGPRRQACRGWNWPARHTREWASPPASGADERRARPCATRCAALAGAGGE